MSNPTTYYTVGGVDLSNIFQPYISGPKSITTGYTIPFYGDLNNVFAPYTSGDKAIETGFRVGNNDLNNIFAKTTNFIVSGGNYSISSFTTTSTTTTTTYTILINPGTTTLLFNKLPDDNSCNFQVIGAGGGGGGTWTLATFPDSRIYSGAGGGGGGNLLINNFIVDNNVYTITVGNGGIGGDPNNAVDPSSHATPGTSGGTSNIIGTGINCIVNGGSGGNCGQDGVRALGGSGGSVTIPTLSTGMPNYDMSNNLNSGGQGNAGTSFNSGTNGVNSYFYNNPGLSYSPSNQYPTYYAPSFFYSPSSITLTNWYEVSGGGGGANSNGSNVFAAYQGGSGRGLGGLNGGNFSSGNATYPSFGGGGGGGSITGYGFDGGNGLAVVWFSYSY